MENVEVEKVVKRGEYAKIGSKFSIRILKEYIYMYISSLDNSLKVTMSLDKICRDDKHCFSLIL